MGAGRKTETFTLGQDLYGSGYGTICGRNLKKGDLCAVIFGCKFSTNKECYAKKLFGLPAQHMAYIQKINPGLTLFLFNYSDRTLHGIFEAASEGKLNIDPKAWSLNGTDPSPYPAQVKIRIRVRCEGLAEEKFRPVIADNYKDEKMFWFELDRDQTNKLLRLFKPLPSSSVKSPSKSKDAATTTSRKAIPASSLVEIGGVGATRVDKWSSLFKSSDELTEKKEAGSNLVSLGKTRGWEAPPAPVSNVDKGKAQVGASSYSSAVRNEVVPSQASKGVNNQSVANNTIGPRKGECFAEETCSEIDWEVMSSFQVHLDGLNKILEEPSGLQRFEGNAGYGSSSSMVVNQWEDEKPWDYEGKSPCGSSSYVSAMTGDDNGDEKEKPDMGSSTFVNILNEILMEVRELRQTQTKQAEYMISLEMDMLDSRKEILGLKRDMEIFKHK